MDKDARPEPEKEADKPDPLARGGRPPVPVERAVVKPPETRGEKRG